MTASALRDLSSRPTQACSVVGSVLRESGSKQRLLKLRLRNDTTSLSSYTLAKEGHKEACGEIDSMS